MTESHPTSINPADILKLKDVLHEAWQQLPAEHQATQLLVLLNHVLEGEYGPWTLSAIELLWKTHAQPDARLLPIPALSRADLERANLTPDEIAQLTDDDSQDITQTLLYHYATDVFWDELEYVARLILEKKRLS